MKPLALMLGLVGAAILPYECSAQVLDNPFSEYFQRDMRITPDGGNANDTNAAIHTIDPWPRYARHIRIPGNGQQAVGAVSQMYKTPSPFSGGSSGSGQSSGQTFNLNLGSGSGSGTGSGGY
ncbi:MAG: hypothetical protein WAM08_14990 [Candidatus Acidiferrales bacterium]|jgi:hypothetical protein